MKPFEQWTFDELVEYCEGDILKRLIKGEFHASIWSNLDLAIRWSKEQDKPKTKKKK